MSTPSTHPDARRLADYFAGHLSAPEALDLSDHLTGCPACRAALSTAARKGSAADDGVDLPAIPPDAPPDYEEMAALLDGSLDAAQAADARARLAASPDATAAFAKLQRFRDEIAALPPKWHGPEPASTALGLPAAEDLPDPGKQVPFPRWRLVPWAAAAVAFLVAGWWLAGGGSRAPAPVLWADADLSRLPDGLHREVQRAARTGTIELPTLPAALRPPPGTLAGATPPTAAWKQTAPVGIVVRESRPVLRWTPREDATSYVVYLADADGRMAAQRQELPAGTTEWTPPAPLARGTIFEWQVEARRGNELLDRVPRPPLPEARFEVLDERHDAVLADLERRYPRNPLILGTAYAQAGLEQAAGQQFEALARAYPKSGAAERLRREMTDRSAEGK